MLVSIMSTEQDSKISKIKDSKAKIESENTQIQKRIHDFQAESKKALETFSTSLGQSKNAVLSEINSIIGNIDNLTKELDDYKKRTLESDKAALNTRLDNLLGQISSSVQNLQKLIVDLSTKQDEEVSSIYSQMAGKVNTGLSDIYAAQRDQISEFENAISSRLENIQRDIVSTVESESANQREMTEAIVSSFLTSLTDFQSKIRDLSDTKETNVDAIFAGTVSESVGRLEMAKEDLLASIDGVMNDLEESLAQQKSTNEQMKKYIQDVIVKTKSDIKAQIENLKLESIKDLKQLQEEQLAALSEIKETSSTNFQKALEINESFQANLFSGLDQEFKANLYNEIDNITLSFTKFQDSIINQIDALISRLTSTRDEMKGSLEGLLVSNLNKIGGIGNRLEEQLSEVLSQVSSKYAKSRESTFSNLTDTLEKRFSLINSSFKQYQETTNNRFEKISTDLEVSLMDFFDHTQRNISETVNKNSGTLDQLGNTVNESFKTLQTGQEKNIETTLTDVRNTLRTKQSELITTISSISPASDEHVESHKEYIEERKAEVSRTSSAAFNELRKQITAIEQDGLSTIKRIVRDTHDSLDENVKSSEQSTMELIEGLEDKHKGSISKFRVKSTQELNNNLEMLEEYRGTLEEKFTKFFDDQQHNLESFIEENRARREAVDDQRRDLDIKLEELNSSLDTATETLSMNINTNTENVSTSIKQILRDIDDVIKAMK